MTKANPSQTELYGELLTNEQQYRADLVACGAPEWATKEHELLATQRACSGDEAARNDVLLYLFHRIERFAARYMRAYSWASHRIEYLDLVQVGNEALLTSLDHAFRLEADRVFPYLLSVAFCKIRTYARRYSSAIATPSSPDAEPLPVTSLDQPYEERTLLDILAETAIDEDFAETSHERKDAKEEPLHAALHTLNEKQRLIIVRHFGLYEHAPEPICAIERDLGLAPTSGHSSMQQILSRLCIQLHEAYPTYCSATRDVSQTRQASRFLLNVSVTPQQEQRLQEAYARLLSRGEKVTVKGLAREAHLSPEVSSRYLERFREHAPRLSQEQRLDQAYATLQASEEKINTATLASMAHVDKSVARVYLHMVRGDVPQTRVCSTRPVEDRLEEAYARLLSRGEKVTVSLLRNEAHVSRDMARQFFYQRNASPMYAAYAS